VQLAERVQALPGVEEVQGQQAAGTIEAHVRCIVDVAFQQLNACVQRAQCLLGQREHRRGRIHAQQLPARLRLRKGLQLQPTPGTEYQHAALRGNAFGQQQATHLLQGEETGHLAQRCFGIAGHRLRVGERGHARTPAAGDIPL